jgi:segregation and condensation protein A
MPTVVEELELDLEVFTGPFDLLLTLVLREEVDLLEVELADVVVHYLDVLEARGELDLEVATEFLVLIAALLELKSRLMLPADEEPELDDVSAGEAAEELVARMLEARRYRAAASHLHERLEAEEGYRYRAAALPAFLKRVTYDTSREGVYDPAQLGRAVGGMLRLPDQIKLEHLTVVRVTVAERVSVLRDLLRRAGSGGRVSFDEAVSGADRVTVAVTLWGLLELYKRGEATWEQAEAFGDITVVAREPAAAGAAAHAS